MRLRRFRDTLETGAIVRGALVLLAALALASCATMGDFGERAGGSTAASAEAGHAEQLYTQGQLDQAATEFLALADAARGDAAAHYRLRAAEVMRDRGDIEGAARALGDIKRRRLHGDEAQRLDLLDAEIALKHGDLDQAEALLAGLGDNPTESVRVRALELRARTDLARGDRFASARSRAVLDRDLSGADREQNRRQLVEALAGLDIATLRTRIDTLAEQDALRPWVEQTLRGKGQPLARALPRPSRPVGTVQPGGGGALQAEGYFPPHRIALLLPLSAQFATVAQSIRDGFLSAYFADERARRPELHIYDSGKSPADAIAAYERAVADGADHVIGPLQRESVGELFHQSLKSPVLALNHPDTGEVPPAGSAEFGLLPDAEGAQVAERMRARGITRVAVFAATSDWAERAARAFRAQFEAAGGSIVGETRLADKDVNFATAITQATAALGQGADAGVFVSMRPQQARLLLPQLKVANINLPVYATSHVYSGEANAALDRDLDGIEFSDAPWLFGPVPGRPDRNAVASRIDSANGLGSRLFAFGMDAYALLPYMDWLLAHPDSYLNGATGQLTADSFGRIHRLVGWARFQNGVALPIDGALDSAPLQQ
ncbi:penicillin-binding protein activator [Dokdonella sp.]|uniref:penicillin-binding protein activator n=1 Tax=Dokdonella sp. TaxID=2291710 RepID=UPI0037830F9E